MTMKVDLLPPGFELEGRLRRKFPVEEVEVEAGGRTFRLIRPADIDGLIHRAKEEDELPFWAYLWPASVGMARVLMETPPLDLVGRPLRAMELGAGIGLSGMAAATLGWEVYQTDLVPTALRFAQVNALRNGLPLSGFVADWRRFPVREKFDVIFASDILYEPTVHPALERLLSECLKPGGRFLVTDPCRVYALQFMARLEDRGWSVSVSDAPSRPQDDTAVLLYTALAPCVH